MTKLISALKNIITFSIYGLIFIIPFSTAGIEIFASISIVLWLIKQFLINRLRVAEFFPKTEMNNAILVFFIISVISTAFSVDLKLSTSGLFFKLAEYVLIFFICVDVLSADKSIKITQFVLISSATLLFIDAGFQCFTGKDFIRGFTFQSRLNACFLSSNDFGGWLLIFLPILQSMLLTACIAAKRQARILAILPLVALLSAGLIYLILTFSRAAYLGYLASAIFMYIIFILNKERNLKQLTVFAVSLLVVFVIFGIFLNYSAKNRFFSFRQSFYADSNRADLWRENLAIIEDFPVLGAGPNTYSYVSKNYKLTDKEAGGYSHNCFLQMAAETGLAGLAAFLWIIFKLFFVSIGYIKAAYKNIGLNNALDRAVFLTGTLAGLFAFLVQSFFDTNLFALKLVMFFWCAMGIAASILYNHKAAQKEIL